MLTCSAVMFSAGLTWSARQPASSRIGDNKGEDHAFLRGETRARQGDLFSSTAMEDLQVWRAFLLHAKMCKMLLLFSGSACVRQPGKFPQGLRTVSVTTVGVNNRWTSLVHKLCSFCFITTRATLFVHLNQFKPLNNKHDKENDLMLILTDTSQVQVCLVSSSGVSQSAAFIFPRWLVFYYFALAQNNNDNKKTKQKRQGDNCNAATWKSRHVRFVETRLPGHEVQRPPTTPPPCLGVSLAGHLARFIGDTQAAACAAAADEPDASSSVEVRHGYTTSPSVQQTDCAIVLLI